MTANRGGDDEPFDGIFKRRRKVGVEHLSLGSLRRRLELIIICNCPDHVKAVITQPGIVRVCARQSNTRSAPK